MTSIQTTFKRYELKYMLTRAQKERLMRAMQGHMQLDCYGRTTIRNIYYDTDTNYLVRRSIEKPVYKEKLRVRSYCQAAPDKDVFVELKKKFDHVVYKRRLTMPDGMAALWLAKQPAVVPDGQIAREIEYFRDFYKTLHPAMFLSYEREAFFPLEESEFRLTLDENILARQDVLSLSAGVWGAHVIRPDLTLMELKTAGGLPLWITRFLTEEGINKTSFSKYGTAYQMFLTDNDRRVQYA